ncbi:MAG: phage major capsid protein [Ruminococcaceae bacterium]|nr:phage major capsid protein [Oscillospiraceae bacterium]
MRIDEINTRLAEIQTELETAEGDALTALEQETNNLIAERTRIQSEVQTRQQLRANIAVGLVGTATETHNHEEENNMENRTFTPASEEYRSAFLKRLRGEELTEIEQRAFTFLTTNTSAPLPTQMQNRIIDLIGEEHPIVADVYTLNSGCAISIPAAKSIVADAGKTAEGEDHNDLQVTMSNIDLSGEDYTADVELSYKMAAMAIDAFEDYLITLVAARIGSKLAVGIVAEIKEKMAAANKIQTGVNYANICAGFGELKRVGTVVVYGTRKGVYNKLVGMVDSNKRPIFMGAITEKAAGAILGATIKFEDAVGDNELLIGDPKKYLQNVVVPVMIEHDRVVKKSKLVYAGYTCQEGTLTDDKAFSLVAEVAG